VSSRFSVDRIAGLRVRRSDLAHESAERLGDRLITVSCRVLVDQRGPGAGVPETSHEILEAGDRLPTQENLTETFEVSRTVARRALDILEAEGLINRAQGGRAVVRRYEPLVRRSSLHYRSDPGAPFAEEALATERVPRYSHRTWQDRAGVEAARRLKIGVGDEVMATEYVSYADDTPMMIVTSVEPLAITRGRPSSGPRKDPSRARALLTVSPRSACARPTSSSASGSGCPGRQKPISSSSARASRWSRSPGPATRARPPIETADMLLASDRYELEYATTIAPQQ
jgi:GntR family transcriptional regulator